MSEPIKVGDKFELSYGSCTAVALVGRGIITIRHDDKYAHSADVSAPNLRRGNVRNPYEPSVFGVGRIGVGRQRCRVDGRKTPAYASWSGIIQRGYCPEFKRSNPSYFDVSVCDEWHDFQCFSEWFLLQANSVTPGFQLDKDLRVIGCREYSPESCSFVPSHINSLLNDCAENRGPYPQGVSFDEKRGLYRARIHMDGSSRCLGRYSSVVDAQAAYANTKEAYVRVMAEKHRKDIHPQIYANLKSWRI